MADAASVWQCGAYRLRCGPLATARSHSLIMGVLNVTPDSFSDGGAFMDLSRCLDHALQMAASGADIIDVGGESTRPGALPVSPEEERRRVIPVIAYLAKHLKLPISIDTTKSDIAAEAVDTGASIVNDVSGCTRDLQMWHVVAKRQCGLVVMHAKGTPQTMQNTPRYRNVIDEVYAFLSKQMQYATRSGISKNRMVIDPGIGFGKTAKHNFLLLSHLNRFAEIGRPILIGPSRKSFIGQVLGLPPADRLEGTAAAVAIAIFQGAGIVRVHDVGQMVRVARVADAIRRGGGFYSLAATGGVSTGDFR